MPLPRREIGLIVHYEFVAAAPIVGLRPMPDGAFKGIKPAFNYPTTNPIGKKLLHRL